MLKKCPLFFLLAILLITTSCEKKNRPKMFQRTTLRINIQDEPHSLDSRKARNLNDINMLKLFQEGLLRADAGEEPKLGLASGYTVSDDQLTYTFTLKESSWSNGEPITSHDFAHAWKTALAPDFPSDYAHLLFAVKNAQAIKKGELATDELGVETPDDQTLIIHLEKPTPYLQKLLTMPIYFPVNHNVDAKNPKWAFSGRNYPCSGPYTLTRWSHECEIVAERNMRYWNADALNINRIQCIMVDPFTGLQLFENNEIDWQGSPLSSLPADALEKIRQNDKLHIEPTLHTVFLRLNTDHPYLSNLKLRKALALSINRQELIDHVMQGNQSPALGLVPPILSENQEGYFQDGDVETAKQLLDEALAELDIQADDLESISLLTSINGDTKRLCAAMQDQWRQSLGIMIPIEVVEKKVRFDLISKQDYSIALCDWIADYNDSINFLEVFRSKLVGTNNTGWEDLKYTQLLSASDSLTDATQRNTCLKEAESILLEAMPIVPICYSNMLYVKSPEVCDVSLTATGALDFTNAYFDEDLR